MIIKLFRSLLLLLMAPLAMSEDVYWVLGSFESEEVARLEGVRIAEELGQEVMLYETDDGARRRYQLLASALDESEEKTVFSQRLKRAGVREAWPRQFEEAVPYIEIIFAKRAMGNPISASELAEIDAMLARFDNRDQKINEMPSSNVGLWVEKEGLDAGARTVGTIAGNYIVAGSFRSLKKAKRHADEMVRKAEGIAFYEISVRRVEVSAEKFYRVMIGPVMPDEDQKVISMMRQYGIDDVWVLPSLDLSTERDYQSVVRRITKPAMEAEPDLMVSRRFQLEKTINRSKAKNVDADFNPILLRKISPQFPDPRNRR